MKDSDGKAPQPSNQPAIPLDLDELICKLLNVGSPGCSLTKMVSEKELTQLCLSARDVFQSQNALLDVEPPIKICGDTHGQYPDVLRLFDRVGFPPSKNYLFLGDYVDRGRQNIETISLFFCYKIKYPENFFLLRGNHECQAINRVYGFYDEVSRRYSNRLWNTFQDAFAMMPLTALVSGKILCMHGGLSNEITSMSSLRNMSRVDEPKNPSIQIDLLWSDPDVTSSGFSGNTRGVSYVFGPDVVNSMCKLLDIDLIARAHQVVQDGYEFFAGRKLVTIFSAPHYCGQFDNAAAIMNVETSLTCSFTILRPTCKVVKMNGVPTDYTILGTVKHDKQ